MNRDADRESYRQVDREADILAGGNPDSLFDVFMVLYVSKRSVGT